jgi:hypothetical protein
MSLFKHEYNDIFFMKRENTIMELSIVDEELKPLLEEILIKMIREKRDVFYDIFVEALEDIALGEAIQEGRRDHFVSEKQIFAILEG